MPRTRDCRACQAKQSAIYKKEITEEIKLKGFRKFTVVFPSWQCKACGEIYGGSKENAVFYKLVAEEKAKQLLDKVKASEITSLTSAAKRLNMTRQAVYKALIKGQINYVLIGNQMCPIKRDVERYALKRSA